MTPNQLLLAITIVVLVIIIIFLGKFVYSVFWDKSYLPVRWVNDLEEGRIPDRLALLERSYPDKVRFFNFWFQVARLKEESIPGSFAELGVYKGETARILHYADPSRKLRLFDTFSGFRKEDLITEKGKAATYTERHFANTNVDKVLRLIEGNDNISVHPGNFSDVIPTIEDDLYALVSIDADLYIPTRDGLEYFYPRLSPGGVILIHDFNHKWEGVLKAVREFGQKIPESFTVLPDMDSTAMLVKNR